MQSQNNRKLPPRPEKPAGEAAPAPASAAQDDEAGLWFPFALADSLDKDIFSEFFCEAPAPAAAATPVPATPGVEDGKPCRDVPVEDDDRRGGACAASGAPSDLMPPPKSAPVSGSRQQTMSLADGGDNAGDLSDLVRAGSAGKVAAEAGASSMLSAIGSSICGSNQVLVQRAACRASGAACGGGGLIRHGHKLVPGSDDLRSGKVKRFSERRRLAHSREHVRGTSTSPSAAAAECVLAALHELPC